MANKGELTRQHILAKAAPMFNQRGFAGCSMQDLMTATGLEKGGLYRHFASKEELAVESFKYSLQEVMGPRTGSTDPSSGALKSLRRILSAFVQTPSPIPGGCPLMNAAVHQESGSQTVLVLARDGLALWKSEICHLVEQGIQTGEIRQDVEPRGIANTFIALLEGALMISRLEGTKDAMKDAQATLESILSVLVT